MKYFKTYESFINEAKLSKVFKASKKGSYPATIVVIKNKKVIHQEQVSTPEAIPAAFNVIQKKYPNAIVTVEDSTGATLYREVSEKKAYMTKIDLKDFKAIKKGTKVKYMGGDAEVLDNNGYVLTLKQNGKKFTVNKSMFDHGGMISEGIAQMAKKAYMALKKHFKKSVFSSGPSKLFNIVEPSDNDYSYAVDWVKKNGAKGDKIYMTGTDKILNKIHIAYGQPNLDIQSPDIAEVSIDRPAVNEGWGKAPDANKAIKDLERKGSQIDWLDDADDATKKIWKKAGVNPEDENTVILYSYVSHQWDDAKKILKKYNVDFKELEDPNADGESFIVFVKESVINEAAAIKPGEYIKSEYGHYYQRVAGSVGGQPAFVDVEADKKGKLKIGKRKSGIHSSTKYVKVDIEDIKASLNISEDFINEAANVPSNIEKFAKERGVLRDVKQIARWAEKAGKRITGGTAIGKGYDTLVLDLTYQGAEVYYDTYKGTIKVNGKPVDSWKTFSKAVEESVTEAEMTKKTFLDLWKEIYGENFISEFPAVAKILKNRPNDIDKREISRIWDETYGEDFKEEYPGIWDKLD